MSLENFEDSFFVVIAESKDEAPLVYEGTRQSYNDAYNRMESLRQRPDVIRVAIAKLEFAYGNKTLFETGNK